TSLRQDGADLVRLEHADTFGLARLAKYLFAWLPERGAVAHWPVDEPFIVGILENRANALNLITQGYRTQGLRKRRSQPLKVIAGQAAHEPTQTEGIANPFAGAEVIGKRPLRNLAGVNEVSFGRKKAVEEIPDREDVAGHARGSARVEVVFLVQILLQRAA